jgi:hypothetical protein
MVQTLIPRDKLPKIGDWVHVAGFPGVNTPYEIIDICRIGNRTFFQFNIGDIEYNAIIDLNHYKLYEIIRLINADD